MLVSLGIRDQASRGRKAARSHRTPAGWRDAQQRLALPQHGLAVLAPVGMLAGDRPVVVHQRLDRVGQVDHLGRAVDLHPGTAEIIGQDDHADLLVAAGVAGLGPLRVGGDHDPAFGVDPAGHGGCLGLPSGPGGDHDGVMPGPDEVEQLVSRDGGVHRDLGAHGTTVARGSLDRPEMRAQDGGMSELPTWARDALAGVYDPCCQEKGISVVDMGLIRSVQVEDGKATVELLLTSGWCPFAAPVLTQVKAQILGQPGISDADVSIVWDEAWTTDRLSPRARKLLRFLPPPSAVPDRDAYIAAHTQPKEQPR